MTSVRYLLVALLLSVFLLVACSSHEAHAKRSFRSLDYYERMGNERRDSVVRRLRDLFRELSDAQSFGNSLGEEEFPCPPPYVRKDEDVNTFVSKLQSIKCLDDKLIEFENYIKSSAILFTVSQAMKIIEQFSKILFVKKQITSQLINRLSSLTGSEAVTLLKIASDSALERLVLLENVKTNIVDLPQSKSSIVSIFEGEAKTKAGEVLDQVKYHDCVFGSISGDNILFTIDTSPSMEFKIAPDSKSNRLDFVKLHFAQVLSKLTPSQKFNINFFNMNAKLLYPDFIPATPENIEKAVSYVKNSIKTDQFTNLEAAMRSSFSAFQSKDIAGSKVVYLLSDGVPTAGEQNTQKLLQIIEQLAHYSKVKVNSVSFNLGNDYGTKSMESDLDKNNAALILNKVAESTGGVFKRIQ